MSDWKPIGTAPLEERCLLYWARSQHIEDGSLFEFEGGIIHVLFDGERLNDELTHWMPLPEPPKE